jgi:hypothetical protein
MGPGNRQSVIERLHLSSPQSVSGDALNRGPVTAGAGIKGLDLGKDRSASWLGQMTV